MRLDRATREPAADLGAKLSAGIYEQLFERIVGGEFAVNARLPSERSWRAASAPRVPSCARPWRAFATTG